MKAPVCFENDETHYALLGAWFDRDVTWLSSRTTTLTGEPAISTTTTFSVSTHDPKRWIEDITLHSDQFTDIRLSVSSEGGRIRMITTVYSSDDVVLGTLTLDTCDSDQLYMGARRFRLGGPLTSTPRNPCGSHPRSTYGECHSLMP